MLNLSKTGGDHSGPASDHSAGGHTNVDDEDDLDEDDDNISDGEEDDIKDHGKQYEIRNIIHPTRYKVICFGMTRKKKILFVHERYVYWWKCRYCNDRTHAY